MGIIKGELPQVLTLRDKQSFQSFYDMCKYARNKRSRRFRVRFVTLTVSRNRPDLSNKLLKGWLETFIGLIRKKGFVEFVGVLGSDGRHIHLAIASNYMKQRYIADMWFKASGYRVVHVAKIYDEPNLYHYFKLDKGAEWVASKRFGQVNLTSFLNI